MAGSKGSTDLGTAYITVVPSMDGFGSKLQKGLQTAMNSANVSFDKISSGLSNAISKSGKAGFADVSKQAEGIKLPKLKLPTPDTSNLDPVAKSVSDKIGGALSSINNGVSMAFTGIKTTVTSIFSSIGSVISKPFTPLVSKIQSGASAIGTAFSNVRSKISSVGQGIAAGFQPVTSAIQSTVDKAGSALGSFKDKASGVLSTVKDKASDFASGVGGVLSKVGSVAASIGVTVAKVGLAGVASAKAAIDGTVAAAVNAYSDYDQLTGGMEVLFKGASDTVIANAQNAWRTAGMSANEYMTSITGIAASLTSSLGGDYQKAAALSDTAMQDIADNASVFNKSADEVQEVYQSLARGNYQMLDSLSLGYAGTKEGLKQLVKDANEYGKATGEATDLSVDNYADVVQAIHQVQEHMGIMGNAGREATETLSGSIGMLKASWENWLTAIAGGGDVEAATSSLVDSFGSVIENLMPVIAQAFAAMVEALPDLIAKIGDKMHELMQDQEFVDKLYSGITAAWQAVGSILQQTPELFSVIGDLIVSFISSDEFKQDLATAINTTWNAISDALGLDLPIDVNADDVTSAFENIKNAVGYYLDTMSTWWDNFIGGITSVTESEDFQSALGGLKDAWDTLTTNLQPFIGWLQDTALPFLTGPFANFLGTVLGGIFEGIIKVLTFIIMLVANVVGAITDFVTGAKDKFDEIKNGISDIKDNISNFFDNIKSKASDFVNGIKYKFNDAKDAITGIPDKIKDAFSNLHIEIPHFKVPKIDVEWHAIGDTDIKIPSLSVSWNAMGGIYDMASLVGVGVGEAGPEAVVPLEGQRKMRPFARAVAAEMPDSNGGATYNTYIDGAKLNDEDGIIRILMMLFKELQARGAMYGI